MKTARMLNRRRLTSLGRLLGNPGFALCIVGTMGGACSNNQAHDPLATVDQEVTAPTGSVVINEVLFDPKGQTAADAAYQYIEIAGPAGDTLEGYYVVVVDGRQATAGDVLAVVNLGTACNNAPCAIGTDGLLMITPSLTAGQTVPAGTTHVALGYTMVNTAGTGNPQSNISILVLDSPTTAITTSTKLAGDAGTLALPTGATLADGIGWRETTTGKVFGVDVKPNTAAQRSPSAIVRISTCTTANSAACWFYAAFPNPNTGSGSTLTFDTTTIHATESTVTPPAGVTALTPGLANTAANVEAESGADAGADAGTGTGGSTSTSTTAAGGTTSTSTTGTKPTGGATSASTTGTRAAGGTTAVSTAATTPAGGTTAVSTTGTTAAGGTTATSTTGTKATGGTTTATTGTSAAGGTTAASTTGTKATGGATTTTTGTKATGGKTGTSTTGKAGATSTAAAGDSGSSSGCGCRTAGRSRVPASGIALIVALAGGLLARRRRRT